MMKKIIAILFVLGLASAIIFITVVTQVYRFWIQDASDQADPILFTIEQGTSFSTVADELSEQGLIASDLWFSVYTKLDGSAKSIRAGSYQLSPGTSYSELVDMLTEYSQGQDVSITIPEGYSLKQIGEVVTSKFDISQEDWDYWTGINSPLETHEFIIKAGKPDSVDLEGYLFPDTYRFYPDATAGDIVTTMVDQMQANVEEIDGIAGVKSIHELLTLASIIEKEVPSADEMKVVSGIFHNRLDIGMPLQSCATVNYVTGKDDPAVSAQDLEIDSPYNTYMYAGLTPGPISNPGINSIDAALHPQSNDYLYFLATPQGETIYAKTFDEHVANKTRYLY
ncbi:endolytic transglycosylase MltG [Patescibacteria group bacterium]|nr:endolytic transglycosylase MltG [Patescibacteria group bacterium]MCG2687984.1 endolytic transglycosylase MltG [Candidatus Parcubacteria bacterium]